LSIKSFQFFLNFQKLSEEVYKTILSENLNELNENWRREFKKLSFDLLNIYFDLRNSFYSNIKFFKFENNNDIQMIDESLTV
jgi:hypothetical protein